MYKDVGGKLEKEQCYDHVGKSVKTSLGITLNAFWNQEVRTA